jgi:hypothetical protein
MSLVGGGLDTHKQLTLPAPISAPWEWGKGHWTVNLTAHNLTYDLIYDLTYETQFHCTYI